MITNSGKKKKQFEKRLKTALQYIAFLERLALDADNMATRVHKTVLS